MRQKMYKLVNGTAVEYAGQSVILDDMVYCNPSDEVLWNAGYRPLGTSEVPDFDIETEMLKVDHYTLNSDGSEIIAVYTIEKWSEIEETNATPTFEERLTAVEKAGLERDIALMELAAMLAGGM